MPNMKRAYQRLGIQSVSLKTELFLLYLRQTGIGAAFAFLIALFVQDGWEGEVVLGVILAFTGVLYLLWRRRPGDRDFQRALYSTFCTVMSIIMLPIFYFYGGGISSGTPLIFLFTTTACALLLDGWLLYTTIGVSAAVFVGALWYDHTHPLFAEAYAVSGHFSYFLIPITFIAVGLSVGAAFRLMLRNYRENQKMSEELLRQVREVAQKDPLTNTFDRGYLYNYLQESIRKVDDKTLPTFSVIMFDIDFFKNINDRYGHLVGDDCLRNLADIVRRNLRKDDLIARYGGEEFVCVLPGADAYIAYKRAELLREEVSSAPLSKDMESIVTISAGVAQYIPGLTVEQFLRIADSNLYHAKRHGRNQVVWQPDNQYHTEEKYKDSTSRSRRVTDLKDTDSEHNLRSSETNTDQVNK